VYRNDLAGCYRPFSSFFVCLEVAWARAGLDSHHEPFGFWFNFDLDVLVGEGFHDLLEPLRHGHIKPFVLVGSLTVQIFLL